MTQFLAIQNSYSHVQLGLFQDEQMLGAADIDKKQASKECINRIDQLLVDHRLPFTALSFIAVNQGPGPSTTLRMVISTVNGLNFATKIPLIGVHAIQAFLHEYLQGPYANRAALLNAFGHELYYGVQAGNKPIKIGCESIQKVLTIVAQEFPDGQILFLGNGIAQCTQMIITTFADRAHFLKPSPETVSLKQIAAIAFDSWKKQKNISGQLQPIYLKKSIL